MNRLNIGVTCGQFNEYLPKFFIEKIFALWYKFYIKIHILLLFLFSILNFSILLERDIFMLSS